MIEPINFNERPSTIYSEKFDENFNIKQEYLKSLNKYEPLVKEAIIYELNEKKEEYKQYKINRDKFFNTYKTYSDQFDFYCDMRENIEKYPKFKEKYKEFWKEQPNLPKHPLCKL